MGRDYYLVLGVPADAAPGTIRSAFRRLVRRYHPDRGLEADPKVFREAVEAYRVLGDPRRRARYDRHVDVPVRVSEPVEVAVSPETVRPSLDALLDRLARNAAGAWHAKGEHPEPLQFELILSEDEARWGVRVPFEVPVFERCRGCDGTGRHWAGLCLDCQGEGRLVDRAGLDVVVPGGVRDGAVIDVSLDEIGVGNLWLRLHVRVAPHPGD